ncbi:universal stress protein [Maribacter chungangensis]|uniref:Universal stress protein n=1 Tax=Maribacter chungangensis TaxID=1069117 RepID=A0ABW3B3N3_9FLAO
MKEIRKILIPFNFSRAAKRALDYAVDYVGKDENLQIVLAYISDDQNLEKLREDFKFVEEQYRALLKHPVEWVSKSGPLTETLISIQKTKEIDLIVMGTFSTLGVWDDELSNTAKVVLEAACPVLVVPYDLEKFRLKNIALVLGKEEIENTKVLDTLLNVARKFNAKVHVITVENKPETYGYSQIDEKNENALQYYLENFYAQHIFIKNPDILEGILTYTKEKNIDMIAILPRNHISNGQPSEGQLTQKLTLHSKIPVLAIDKRI